MDELYSLIELLINSETDDMILDLVYEMHSSLKGIPQEQIQINKTNPLNKQTCSCPNCGQTNLIATRFSYHLAKCLGAGRQSSRQAQRRIIDQNNLLNDEKIHLSPSYIGQIHFDFSNENADIFNTFDHDDEDDWKPKRKKRRLPNKQKKNKNLLVVSSPTTSNLNYSHQFLQINQFESPDATNNERILFRKQNQTYISSSLSEYSSFNIDSPFNLVEDDQSSIIVFKEDIKF